MRLRSLPRRPDVVVTELGFGGAPVGDLYVEVSDNEATGTVSSAWEGGIRYFDTAPHYGAGLSERRVGAGLAALTARDWTLSTKVGRLLVAEGSSSVRRVVDFTRDGVRRSLDESLSRLGVDRVDIVLVHDPDDHWSEASEISVPALCELRDEGLIGAVGVGTNDSGILARFVEHTDVDVVMCAGRYSLLEQPALTDLLPLAVERRVAVLAAGVFNSGLLARADVPDDARYNYRPAAPPVLERARELARVCREHGSSLPAAAVHFVRAHPAVVSVVLGMGSTDDVVQDLALLDAPPPVELWEDLRSRGLLDPTAPVPGP